VALAGSPYNLAVPAPGLHLKVQPQSKVHPVIRRAAIPSKKSAHKKKKRSRAGAAALTTIPPVSSGIPAVTRPPQRSPVAGRQLLPTGRTNLGGTRTFPTRNPIPKRKLKESAVGRSAGGFAPRTFVRPSVRGGFAPPPRVAGQVHMRNALSRQQIASFGVRKGLWEDYKRAIKEQKRRDEARVRERAQRLSREAYTSGADCDDNDAQIHPGLLEVCDHKDNNCDMHVDEGVTILSYADLDGDGHGDPASAVDACPSDIRAAQSRGEWLSTVGNDCDDHDPDHWHDCPATGSTR